MSEPLILTFDCGTQSIRCTLVNKQGQIIGLATERCKPYFSLKRGWAEQYAEVYEQTICDVAKKLHETHARYWDDVIAVTATAVRDTGVCMGKDGKVLRPIIMWLDQREAEFDYKKVPLLNRMDRNRKDAGQTVYEQLDKRKRA